MGQVKGSSLRIRGTEDRTFGSSPRTRVEEFENEDPDRGFLDSRYRREMFFNKNAGE